MRQLFVPVLVVLSCGACASKHPVNPAYSARPVAELGRWPVMQDDRQLGWVVMLEIQDPVTPLRYYRIENQRGQWLGTATIDGRFSRRVPFRDDEEDLGIYPMAQGVQRLVASDKPVVVVGRPDAAAVEAGMHRQRPRQP
jgi:hypothetical protein